MCTFLLLLLYLLCDRIFSERIFGRFYLLYCLEEKMLDLLLLVLAFVVILAVIILPLKIATVFLTFLCSECLLFSYSHF